MLHADVRIDLGRADVGVAEDDGAKIGTAIQQGGSAGVPEHVCQNVDYGPTCSVLSTAAWSDGQDSKLGSFT
jgi:hypothetical protein